MEALEKIKEAEIKAAELKEQARAASEDALTQAENDARRDAEELIAKAKKDAAGAVAAARSEAEKKAAVIRKKGEAEQGELTQAASKNEKKAVNLILSKL